MLILIVAVLAGLGFLVLLATVAYSVWVVHGMTTLERVAVSDHPAQLNLQWEDVAFFSRGDNILSNGWYLPAGTDERCIVLVQGTEHHRNSPRIGSLKLGGDLVGCGFSVFLFDFRARGESGGNRSSEGDQEQWDLLGAIDYVTSRGIPVERIGLLRFSLGAGVSILVAAQEPRIPAVVSDSGFLDYLMELRCLYLGPIRLPSWFGVLVVMAGGLFFKADLSKVRPIQVVDQIEQPIFFIHGENDPVIPIVESHELHSARNNHEHRIGLVPDAEHVNVYRKRPDEYVSQVSSFFLRHIA